jgi:hypothetical protein
VNALILFSATAGLVFALGLQSLNVNGRHFIAAGCTSFLIGCGNLVLFKTLPGPTSGPELAAYLCGGPVGIVVAMTMHPRMVRLWTRLTDQRRNRALLRTLPRLTVENGPAFPRATSPTLVDQDFAGWLTSMEKTFVAAVLLTGLAAWIGFALAGWHIWVSR